MAKILVAEDDELTRYLLELSLKQQGHMVATAMNGREAITVIASEQPDVILLDLMMPGINGLEVIRTVRDEPDFEFIRIIVITGTAEPEKFPETALADLVLHKPVPIDTLLEHIRSFL
jgi:CheY-like chemotaxis protein